MRHVLIPIGPGDFHRWRALYSQYCAFYNTDLPDAKADTVWGWLQDSGHVVEGRFVTSMTGGDAAGVEESGEVIGLCHFRALPMPLEGAYGGFIDDLFIEPDARGDKAGESVARQLMDIGRERGWVSLQWLTADDNYRGRSLYDRFAKRTMWITYEADLS